MLKVSRKRAGTIPQKCSFHIPALLPEGMLSCIEHKEPLFSLNLLSVSRTLLLTSNKENLVERMGCDMQSWLLKGTMLPPCSSLLDCSPGKASFHAVRALEQSMERTTYGNRAFWYYWLHGSEPPSTPGKPSGDSGPSQHLSCNLTRNLEPEPPN